MSLFKFKFFTLISSLLLLQDAYSFEQRDCVKSSFESEVSHKGQPFGFAKNRLMIKKTGCELRVSHEKLKFVKSSWLIDVCREPVHIKKTSSSVEVLKRTGRCESSSKSDYCKEYLKVKEILQDDGLIFAKGEKEDLTTDHGKVYCTYLLVDTYLQSGKVLSRHNSTSNFLSSPGGSMPSQSAPVKKVEEVEKEDKSSNNIDSF